MSRITPIGNENKDIKYYLFYLWTIFLLLGIFCFIISLFIEMPYYRWLDKNLPVWGAILNYVVFSICFAILAIPDRSLMVNHIVGTIIVLSSFIAKVSMSKAKAINIIILIVSVIIHYAIKNYYKQKTKITKR